MLSIDTSLTGLAVRGLSAVPALPETGLIANWLFEEGSGTTVADETGNGYTIDLTLAPSATNTWETHGVSADSSAIQTPSITDARTICMLYRVNAGTGGFHQTGPTGTNKGILGSATTGAQVLDTTSCKVAKGSGIGDIWFRSDTSVGSWSLNTGGWQLVFRELAADTTGYLTFGGRGGVTSSRNTQYDLAWAGVYDQVLADADREDIFAYVRTLLVARGAGYVHFADCPTQVDAIVLAGQSNADGASALTGLSAGDQARTYDNIKIQQNVFGVTTQTFAALALGSNHNESASNFGLEVIMGNLREDNSTGRDLYFLKTADGGTFLAPSSDANVAAGSTWSTDELETAAGFYNSFLRNLYYGITDALENGIGLNFKAVIWWQGESDADFTSTADVYSVQLTQLIDEFDDHTGLTSVPWHIVEIRDDSPANATAYADVRADQAAVVATDATRFTLHELDGYAMLDDVHVGAGGMTDAGVAIYNDIFNTSLTYTAA